MSEFEQDDEQKITNHKGNIKRALLKNSKQSTFLSLVIYETKMDLFSHIRSSSRRVESMVPGLFFVYVILIFGLTAILQDGLFERDGYYHARLSQMVPVRLLDREFPWTQLSTWREHFCDKEFLYHVAMMPFAQLGDQPIFGARLFSCLLSLTVLLVLYGVLRIQRCPWPLLFVFLPLAAGGLFIARLGMIRSHVLSMALLLFGMHLLLRGRWRSLCVLGFVYAWSYTMPFVLLMTAIPFTIGVWLMGGGMNWKMPVAAGAGSAIGLLLHPYFPETIESFLTYIQVFRIGMQGTGLSGFELGNEIYSYSLPVFFDIYPLVVLGVPVLLLYSIWQRKHLTSAAVGALCSALFWVAMTVASARFVEYSVLLLALAAALVVRDAPVTSRRINDYFTRHRDMRRTLKATLLAVLIGFHVRSMSFYWYYQTKAAPPRFFTGAAQWMKAHLKPGESVINLFWDDFPDLFYDAPRQHYIWGLDPTYSIREDSEKALLLERFRTHQLVLDPKALARLFQSRYLILRTSREWRFPEIFALKKVYGDDSGVIYLLE